MISVGGHGSVQLGLYHRHRAAVDDGAPQKRTAIAQAAGMLNLFNLMPLGPLDGGRAFNALTRPLRLLMAATLGGAWLLTHNGIALLVLIVAVARALSPRAPAKGEWMIAVEYLALVAALSYLAALPVPSGVR
ncbi:MAG TPA: hypothetical protein VGH63_08660 [Polyangia bacterium]